MLIKDNKPRELHATARFLLAISLLGLGIVTGLLLRPSLDQTTTPLPLLTRSAVPSSESLPKLPVLEVRYDQDAAATLQAARARALKRGVLVQREEDIITGTVTAEDKTVSAKLRLKGDWTDHIETDKWSLRIELKDGRMFGMSRFSVQHPKTRGYVMEWLINEAARREGMLAPRARFVDVKVNGTRLGIFYLEEHFTKELLEAQGRREGPIVRYDESTLWSAWLQYNYIESGTLPIPVAFSQLSFAAKEKAFDEKRMAKSPALNARLQRAIEQMADLQRLILSKEPLVPFSSQPMELRRRQALADLKNSTIDELFVTDKLGRLFALYSLFGADHGLAWHQFRFYHDPVLDRLEPILFDTGARMGAPYGPIALMHPYLQEYFASDQCRESAWRDLARFTRPQWLANLRAATEPHLQEIWAHLVHEELLPEGASLDKIYDDLAANAKSIHAVLTPKAAVNFRAAIVRDTESVGSGHLEVEAWATTSIPLELESFVFSNGERVAPAEALPEAEVRYRRADGKVVLPRHSHPLTFTFPLDERLLKLSSIQAVTEAIRKGRDPDQSVRLQVTAVYRPIGTMTPRRERLLLRRKTGISEGRPQSPSLLTALKTHSFLEYNLEYNLLGIKAGDWDISEDLLLGPHHPLHIRAGTTLRFAAGVVMASESPVLAQGTAEKPIVFCAKDPTEPWSGLVVFDCDATSKLTYTTIRGAAPLQRSGWQTTGAITFYRSPVDLIGCTITKVRGEDALNIFGTQFKLLGTTISAPTNDLFDGDFVQGTVQHCTFEKPVEDGIDLSASQVTIENCTFRAIGDKALSIGEGTKAIIRASKITDSSIGLAAKDRSEVTIDGLTMGHCEQYAIAVYVKKPEYGPATVRAKGLKLQTLGPQTAGPQTARPQTAGPQTAGRAAFLVQTGCELIVEGKPIPTQSVDVEAMYRDKILGK